MLHFPPTLHFRNGSSPAAASVLPVLLVCVLCRIAGIAVGRVLAQLKLDGDSLALQTVYSLRFGAFADGLFGFSGDMAHMVVLNTAITADQLAFTYKVGTHAWQCAHVRVLYSSDVCCRP